MWKAIHDSMYLGGSERWNDPYNGWILGAGASYYVDFAEGNISAGWTQTPLASGAAYYVGNV